MNSHKIYVITFLLEHNRTENKVHLNIYDLSVLSIEGGVHGLPQLEAGKLFSADLALCYWVASTPAEVHDSDHEEWKENEREERVGEEREAT